MVRKTHATVFAALFLVAPVAHAQLFTNVTSPSGLNGQKGYSAAPADFDGDGDLDIAIGATSNNTLRMYRNNGSFVFSNATSSVGVPTNMTSARTITFADYNNDGDLDLFFGREVGSSSSNNNLYRNNSGAFTNVTTAAGLSVTNKDPRGSAWFDIDHDGDLDLYLANARDFNGTRDTLFRNNGDGTFTDITNAAGLTTSNDPCFGIAVSDFDNDGDADIYVEAGQIGTGGSVPWPNKLLSNQFVQTGVATFVDVAPAEGVDAKGEGYATFWFDFDNDHDFDLYHGLFTNGVDVFGETNKLFRNEGDGSFVDVAGAAGVKHAFEDNGCQPFDYDYDGFEDFFVTAFTSSANDLLRNNGNGTFSEPANTGMTFDSGGANIIPGDFDGDSDIDLIYVSFSSVRAYQNNGVGIGNHLRVKLVGTQSNRDGVGAIVRVVTADGMSRRKAREIGGGYGSAVPETLSFGLGTNTVAETVEVVWPKSRIVQILTNVAANQEITITETGSPTAVLSLDTDRTLGSPIGIRLRGTPGASASLLLGALGNGPLAVPPYGTLLVDTSFLIILNGFAGAGPFIPAGGVLNINATIPNDGALVGFKVNMQGAQTDAGVITFGNGVPMEFLP